MSLLAILLAAPIAEAWHGHVHHMTGHMMHLLQAPDSTTRLMIDNALIAGTFDLDGGCAYNTWASACSFPDDLKNITQQMTDWHWNDIVGHISYYDTRADELEIKPEDITFGERAPNANLGVYLSPSERSAGKALCVNEADGCYGAVPVGIRQHGELHTALADGLKNYNSVAHATTQGAGPTTSYGRGLMTRFLMHLSGDAHMPLHNGSMFSQIGLDKQCCPDGYTWSSLNKECASDGIGSPLGPSSETCSGMEWPRLWCRRDNDFESHDLAAEGDRGGNFFWVPYDDQKHWGVFRSREKAQNVHWIWDAVFGMFEAVPDADYPEDPETMHLKCNMDDNGELKQFPHTIKTIDPDTGVITAVTELYYQSQQNKAPTYDTEGFDESIHCHAMKMIEDFPTSSIKNQITAIIGDAFADFYTPLGIEAPGVIAGMFDPDVVDLDQWQLEMNFVRDWIIYRPFMTTATKLKGADCPDTGVESYPTNWYKHNRKLSRAMAGLTGYRVNAYMNKLAETYVPSPLQTKMGSLTDVCGIEDIGVDTCGPCEDPPACASATAAIGAAVAALGLMLL